MFPLIWLGGLVTSHGAGMSVPDWPNTFGYNMWAVPWGQWLGEQAGGVFYEHTHRLLGTLVGFFSLMVAAAAWGTGATATRRAVLRWIGGSLALCAVAAYVASRLVPSPDAARNLSHLIGGFGGLSIVSLALSFFITWERRVWLRTLSLWLFLAVLCQGILGGLRVVLVNIDLAIIHGIFGQLTFALAGVTVLASSRWFELAPREHRPSLTLAAAVLVIVCVVQLALGATMRHYEAGLAVPDFPLHYGQVLPPVDQPSLEAANATRAWDYHLPAVTLAQIWLHVAHRIGAVVVTLAATWVIWKLWRAGIARKHATLLTGLIAIQITLGILTVWWGKPADVATLHQATGALLLLVATLLAARLGRRYGWRPMPAATPRRTHALNLADPATVS